MGKLSAVFTFISVVFLGVYGAPAQAALEQRAPQEIGRIHPNYLVLLCEVHPKENFGKDFNNHGHLVINTEPGKGRAKMLASFDVSPDLPANTNCFITMSFPESCRNDIGWTIDDNPTVNIYPLSNGTIDIHKETWENHTKRKEEYLTTPFDALELKDTGGYFAGKVALSCERGKRMGFELELAGTKDVYVRWVEWKKPEERDRMGLNLVVTGEA